MSLNWNPFKSTDESDDFFAGLWTDRSKNAYKDFFSGGGWKDLKNWINPGGVMANPAQQIADPGNFFTSKEHEKWVDEGKVSDRTLMSALIAGTIYGGAAYGGDLFSSGAGSTGSVGEVGEATTGSTVASKGGGLMNKEGIMDGISNLFQNQLFQQYLSGAGQDISAGQPIGQNVNRVTQQNISAKSFSEMLKKILGGGSKLSLDKDKYSLSGPSDSLSLLSSSGMDYSSPSLTGPTGESNTPSLLDKRTGADDNTKMLVNPFQAR